MLILALLSMVFYGFVAIFAASYEQVQFVVSLYSAVYSVILLYYCVSRAVHVEINGRIMVIAGFSVFCFADIAKYFAFEHAYRYVDISTSTEVAFLMSAGFFLFMLFSGQLSMKNTFSNNFVDYDKDTKRYSTRNLIAVIITAFLCASIYHFNPDYYKHGYFGILNYFSKAIIIYLVYIYFIGRNKIHLLWAVILGVLVMVDTSRRAFLAVLVPIGVLVLENTFRSYSKLKKTVVVTGALVVLYIFLNMLRGGHDFGQGYKPGDYVANTINYVLSLRSIDTFYNTCFVYDRFPSTYTHLYGETYLAVLVGFVPRSVWPDKPVGFAAPLALMQKTGVGKFNIDTWYEINQFSLSPGFHGEALANFGIPGVLLLSVLLGVTTRYYDRYFRVIGSSRMRDINKLCVLLLFFLIVRGDFYSASIYVLFIFIFVTVVDRFVAIRTESLK